MGMLPRPDFSELGEFGGGGEGPLCKFSAVGAQGAGVEVALGIIRRARVFRIGTPRGSRVYWRGRLSSRYSKEAM